MNIKNLHEEYGYCVKAVKDKNGNACDIYIPEQCIYQSRQVPAHYLRYDITDTHVYLFSSLKQNSSEVWCPGYAQRLLVSFDLVFRLMDMKLPADLIICYDEEHRRQDDEFKLRNLFETPTDTESEDILRDLSHAMLEGMDGTEKARDHHVLDGYEILFNIARQKGIEV